MAIKKALEEGATGRTTHDLSAAHRLNEQRIRRRIAEVAVTEFELADEFLPVYDVSDAVGMVVDAHPARTWDTLMAADLIQVGRRRPLVGVLGALRALPDVVAHVLHGEGVSQPPKRLTLRDTASIPPGDGGWVLLGERPGREIALGLIGKFWRPVITYASIDPQGFREFADPGYAKTVYALAVQPLNGNRTMLSAVMRTVTTDEHARQWFRRYWTFGVGPGAHVLVNALLDVVREDVEEPATAGMCRTPE